jgi:hypothetical protein
MPVESAATTVAARAALVAARAPRPPQEPATPLDGATEQREDIRPANRFGIAKLLGNPFFQISVSTVLALICIVMLPRTLDILILIGVIALMLFKIF